MARIAVVVTVLNEIGSIKSLVDALRNQAKELIIVDGGSNDGTWEFISKQLSVTSYQVPGNRSKGRNYGVTHTKSPIIAFTDAGCMPQPNWLAEITKPFTDPKVQVVSGYYKSLPENIFQKCLIPYVLVMPDQAGESEFYPASRSMALRRSVWAISGGFNENLWHNEDYEFAHRLKKLNYSFTFAPKAVVGWQPRKNLRETAWMFLRFAIGDVQAGILRPKVKSLFLRYYVFFFLFFINHWFALLVIPYIIWAVAKNYRYVKDLRACFWLPVLQLTADTCVIFGTIMGVLSKHK